MQWITESYIHYYSISEAFKYLLSRFFIWLLKIIVLSHLAGLKIPIWCIFPLKRYICFSYNDITLAGLQAFKKVWMFNKSEAHHLYMAKGWLEFMCFPLRSITAHDLQIAQYPISSNRSEFRHIELAVKHNCCWLSSWRGHCILEMLW